MDLGEELALEVSTELLRYHGIDVTYFWPGSITLGADAQRAEVIRCGWVAGKAAGSMSVEDRQRVFEAMSSICSSAIDVTNIQL